MNRYAGFLALLLASHFPIHQPTITALQPPHNGIKMILWSTHNVMVKAEPSLIRKKSRHDEIKKAIVKFALTTTIKKIFPFAHFFPSSPRHGKRSFFGFFTIFGRINKSIKTSIRVVDTIQKLKNYKNRSSRYKNIRPLEQAETRTINPRTLKKSQRKHFLTAYLAQVNKKYQLDLKPHEVLFIDSNKQNVRAAQNIGMHAIHFSGHKTKGKKLSIAKQKLAQQIEAVIGKKIQFQYPV